MRNAFLTSKQPKRFKLLSCQKVCDAFHYLLDSKFIRFGSKNFRHSQLCTNCAPLVTDLVSFCYVRDFMLLLSDNNHTYVVEAFLKHYLKISG